MPRLLGVSLSLFLVSAVAGIPSICGVAIAASIVGLTGFSRIPRWLLFLFWLWLSFILLFLTLDLHFLDRWEVFGLPVPTLVMLLGVWIIPVFIWPLGYLLLFDGWYRD